MLQDNGYIWRASACTAALHEQRSGMLMLAVISLVSSLLYGVYRKNKNKKEGFAERNVNKEDLSWLLDVEYGVDEEENKK